MRIGGGVARQNMHVPLFNIEPLCATLCLDGFDENIVRK